MNIKKKFLGVVLWRMCIFVSILTLSGCGGNDIVGKTAETGQESSGEGRYSWMTLRLPWEGNFDMPFIGGGFTKESQAQQINLKTLKEYTIYVTLGSTEYRVYNVVAIRSNGEAIAAYKDPQNYRYYQKKFRLNSSQLQKLFKVLKKNNAGSMVASSVSEDNNKRGLIGGFTLVSGKKVRRSYFNDSWPKDFKNIVDFINESILCYQPDSKDNGFSLVTDSIITVDPEATLAARGLIDGK